MLRYSIFSPLMHKNKGPKVSIKEEFFSFKGRVAAFTFFCRSVHVGIFTNLIAVPVCISIVLCGSVLGMLLRTNLERPLTVITGIVFGLIILIGMTSELSQIVRRIHDLEFRARYVLSTLIALNIAGLVGTIVTLESGLTQNRLV